MCDGRTVVSVVFDGSFDGFLCAVYAYYYDKIEPMCMQTADLYQQTLEAEALYIATDTKKAVRVMDGINNKISPDAGHYVCSAFLASGDDPYMDIFRYIRLGFTLGASVDNHLQTDYVLRVHKLARYVNREAHLLKGFCRFVETQQGVFYCAISPINHVLPILAEHFRERFMNQAWVIHDKKHSLAAVYDGVDYIIDRVPADAQVANADGETAIQNLWVTFFDSIAIRERTNKNLQRQLMPLYFRKSITEFHHLYP